MKSISYSMFRSIKPLHCDHDVILLREVIFLMDYMMLRIYSMCLYNTSMEELSIVFLLFSVLFFLSLFNSFYYLNQSFLINHLYYSLFVPLYQSGVGDRQGGLACCYSWDRQESDMTERLNQTELNRWESQYYI